MCGRIAAMVDGDLFDRAPRALKDGEVLELGRRRVRWLDAPHLPHGWECGYLFEESTATLLCGDLFTQPGADHPALTRDDILEPSEAMRRAMDYYAHGPDAPRLLEKLAATSPRLLRRSPAPSTRRSRATTSSSRARPCASRPRTRRRCVDVVELVRVA
ncbi:hypothetical protein BE18_38085 [Sorangium cellulosum]|uniref:Metallo-beta-lactamase domain-containing protein n=1 Tax=Sorangium cellulosum TaxID=56 RepID=A0A150T8G3_SORCE|nr:hypothetical protein BE18_38085 [Sorangium cellulosum]